MTSLAYPQNGPVFHYGFDAMGRLGSMTQDTTLYNQQGDPYPGPQLDVATASYGVAGS